MQTTNIQAEKTYMITKTPYTSECDTGADCVIIYGLDDTVPERIKSWKKHGYKTNFMTSLSWGDFQDYINGKTDGNKHTDEIQMSKDGTFVIHSPSVPYIVPTLSFIDYFVEKLKKVADLGVDVFFFESAGFFSKSGYCEAFKREWMQFYGEPWVAPHTSVDAQFKASKLKSFLFKRCIIEISSRIKQYSIEKHKKAAKIYLATHSQINYTQWDIVSPIAELLNCPEIDGFAAQIWASTTRVQNVYCGERAERIFPTAFLEYGAMQELVIKSKKDMIFLSNPIEDNMTLDWDTYRDNYTKTLIASLLHPRISKFFVFPFPDAVFTQKYPRDRKLGSKYIPESYKTVLFTVMNAISRMSGCEISTPVKTLPIGIITSDTSMYQREYPDDIQYKFAYSDSIEDFSCFYGMALPLLLNGIPIRPLSIENIASYPDILDRYKIILLSYEFMKPLSAVYHYVLDSWVRHGGILVYIGDDSDPFNGINEWWEKTPAAHLFDTLGITAKINTMRKKTSALSRVPKTGIFDVGHGSVAVLDENPAKCAQDKAFSQMLLKLIYSVAEKRNVKIEANGSITVNRGPYKIIATFDGIKDSILPLNGNYIDLLSEKAEYETFIVSENNSYYLLYDLDTKTDNETEIIAISAKTDGIISNGDFFSFTAKSPENMICVCRLYCKKNAEVFVNGHIADFKRQKDTIVFTFPGGKNKIEIVYK